ncbi:MAG: metallophosphoesterase, partial [Comamonadaceae bacterium]
MPFRSLTFLTALLHVYLALRLLPAIASATPAWPVLAVLLAISAVAMPLPFVGLWAGARRLGNRWQWLGLLAMGWFSSMFVLTVLRDAFLLVAG